MKHAFYKGAIACIPLCVAVIPWGILAGSFAIEAGLNSWEAQAMSAILFAGSAQLVAIGMFKAGVELGTLLVTILIITSRHFLYSISMREKISPLPLHWRLGLGYLLTDELFALCGSQPNKTFNKWYALGVGGTFYLVWNLSSFVGIIMGNHFPNLGEVGLEFAVAATFIALVVPTIVNLPILSSVLVALILSVLLEMWKVEGALLIASLSGMATGYLCESIFPSKETINIPSSNQTALTQQESR